MAKKVKTIKEVLGVKEDSWAQYSVKDLVPPIITHRYDTNGHRFYFFLHNNEVKTAIGVTSAFGAVSTSDERKGIERWKAKFPLTWETLLDAAADYGTMLHIMFANLALGMGVNKDLLDKMTSHCIAHKRSADMPKKDILALMKFIEDYKVKPLLIEAQLVWQDTETDEYLAMTVDALVQIEDTLVVKKEVEDGVYQRGDKKGEVKYITVKEEIKRTRILSGDLKSNFFEKEEKEYYKAHKLQLMAGMKAIQQNFDIKVDGVFNFSPNNWRTEPSYTFTEHDITDADWDSFFAKWHYIIVEGINRPKGNILICENFKDSNDYKLLSYQEYAEQVLKPQPIVQ